MTEDPKRAALHRAFYGDPNKASRPPEELETPPSRTFVEKIRWKIKIDDPSIQHIRGGAAWLLTPVLIFLLLLVISFALDLPSILKPGLLGLLSMPIGFLRIIMGLYHLCFDK